MILETKISNSQLREIIRLFETVFFLKFGMVIFLYETDKYRNSNFFNRGKKSRSRTWRNQFAPEFSLSWGNLEYAQHESVEKPTFLFLAEILLLNPVQKLCYKRLMLWLKFSYSHSVIAWLVIQYNYHLSIRN